MNSVEVYTLTAAGFAEILDRYPKLKQQLEKKLNFNKSDLFERKIEYIRKKRSFMRQNLRVGFDAQVRQNSTDVRKIIYSREVPDLQDEEDGAVEKKNPFLNFMEHSVLGWGDLDVDLPFIYIAKSRTLVALSTLTESMLISLMLTLISDTDHAAGAHSLFIPTVVSSASFKLLFSVCQLLPQL